MGSDVSGSKRKKIDRLLAQSTYGQDSTLYNRLRVRMQMSLSNTDLDALEAIIDCRIREAYADGLRAGTRPIPPSPKAGAGGDPSPYRDRELAERHGTVSDATSEEAE